MCRLRNIAMRDYQESVTTGQTDAQTDGGTDRQTPDKVNPMCRYASQATQKWKLNNPNLKIFTFTVFQVLLHTALCSMPLNQVM